MSTDPRRIGKYELRERLGRGGMAEVWKALDVHLQRFVAIKFLHADMRTDPDFMSRFVREAQAIASLRHPNIVRIHDFQASSESDNTAYMVMNYVEGPTLAEYIRDTSRMGKFPSANDIVYLFTAVGSAIDYAHQRGMVHRDIKPSNILLDRRNATRPHIGKPVLMDFGIVKMMGVSSGTLTGSFLGTPHYMSPEQAQGRPGDGRSDIYSLGVILYEICTGVKPFQGDNPSVVMMQHIMATPTPPGLINPNIPPALAEVILRSMAKNPADRFLSAQAMTRAMAEALNIPPPTSVSSTPTSRTVSQTNLPPVSSTPQRTPDNRSPSPVTNPQTPYVMAPSTPFFGTPPSSGQHTPTTATGNFSHGSAPVPTSQHLGAITPVQSPPVAVPPSRKRRSNKLLIGIVAAVILIVGASLGSFWLFFHQNNPPVPVSTSFGKVYFVSSSPVNELNGEGINDELSIKLENIANPPAGKSYYAWLLSDESQQPMQALLLGKMTVVAGQIVFPYLHDQQYTNLLAHYSQFLISEEDANSTPGAPSLDKNRWAYYSEIPQTSVSSVTNASALGDIRLLLVQDKDSKVGTDIQFVKNTYQVSLLAKSARDSWVKKDAHALRNQLISILDYIDSSAFIQRDVPGAPLLVSAQFIQVPLLDFSQDQNPTSYITRIGNILNSILGDPGITPAMSSLATQGRSGLADVQSQLTQVHIDAVQLVKMSDAQLLQASTYNALNDMVTAANSAYSEIDLSTNQLQGGAYWVHTQIENLATFEVRKYGQ